MQNFNYLKANRSYNELFYQYPKVFIESKKYKSLSEGSKIAYMLLKARSEVAIYKNQIDANGNLYFEFTGKELAEMMNCSERRITSIKKELEDFCLLKQVKMGFNRHTQKNEKNRLYLAELEVSDNDIYSMQKRGKDIEVPENKGLANFASQYEQNEKDQYTDNTGGSNSVGVTKHLKTLDNSGLAKFAKEFNNNNLDTNRHLKDTDKDQAQEKLLLENFAEIMKDDSIATFIPERVLKLIATFSVTYLEAQQTVKTIHNAKHKAEQSTDVSIVFENLNPYGINAEAGLYNTLLKAYQKQKTEKVDNIQNLIFVYVKNWFVEKPCAAIKLDSEHSELPKVTLFDWSQTDA
ncbi:replication initiator protein A (plasmid) [Enterococcus sp. 22-H-5-01]|uniref:replication initiator protein A n=1 Tax=Enterococcus sp. 22-H-5-01 TaxID=3418555 RepID=UPI003D095582